MTSTWIISLCLTLNHFLFNFLKSFFSWFWYATSAFSLKMKFCVPYYEVLYFFPFLTSLCYNSLKHHCQFHFSGGFFILDYLQVFFFKIYLQCFSYFSNGFSLFFVSILLSYCMFLAFYFWLDAPNLSFIVYIFSELFFFSVNFHAMSFPLWPKHVFLTFPLPFYVLNLPHTFPLFIITSFTYKFTFTTVAHWHISDFLLLCSLVHNLEKNFLQYLG